MFLMRLMENGLEKIQLSREYQHQHGVKSLNQNNGGIGLGKTAADNFTSQCKPVWKMVKEPDNLQDQPGRTKFLLSNACLSYLHGF